MNFLNNMPVTQIQLTVLVIAIIKLLMTSYDSLNVFVFSVTKFFTSILFGNQIWKHVTEHLNIYSSVHQFSTEGLHIKLFYYITELVLRCVCFSFIIGNKLLIRKQVCNKTTATISDCLTCKEMFKFSSVVTRQRLTVYCVCDSGEMSQQCQRVASFINSNETTVSPVVLAENGFFYEPPSTLRCYRCQRALSTTADITNMNRCHEDGCEHSNLDCGNYWQSFNVNQDTMIDQQIKERRQQHQPQTDNGTVGNEHLEPSARTQDQESTERISTLTDGSPGTATNNGNTVHRFRDTGQQLIQPETENGTVVEEHIGPTAMTQDEGLTDRSSSVAARELDSASSNGISVRRETKCRHQSHLKKCCSIV